VVGISIIVRRDRAARETAFRLVRFNRWACNDAVAALCCWAVQRFVHATQHALGRFPGDRDRYGDTDADRHVRGCARRAMVDRESAHGVEHASCDGDGIASAVAGEQDCGLLAAVACGDVRIRVQYVRQRTCDRGQRDVAGKWP
jgi:hypothetical protein